MPPPPLCKRSETLRKTATLQRPPTSARLPIPSLPLARATARVVRADSSRALMMLIRLGRDRRRANSNACTAKKPWRRPAVACAQRAAAHMLADMPLLAGVIQMSDRHSNEASEASRGLEGLGASVRHIGLVLPMNTEGPPLGPLEAPPRPPSDPSRGLEAPRGPARPLRGGAAPLRSTTEGRGERGSRRPSRGLEGPLGGPRAASRGVEGGPGGPLWP